MSCHWSSLCHSRAHNIHMSFAVFVFEHFITCRSWQYLFKRLSFHSEWVSIDIKTVNILTSKLINTKKMKKTTTKPAPNRLISVTHILYTVLFGIMGKKSFWLDCFCQLSQSEYASVMCSTSPSIKLSQNCIYCNLCDTGSHTLYWTNVNAI